MDISMPEMDGVEATQFVKAEMPNVRVIGLSMFKNEQTAGSMHLAGGDDFVAKTASSAELLKSNLWNQVSVIRSTYLPS